jgi:hypothetical protein
MRYCRNCQKFTSGQPAFCQFCGRSYGVKLCPRGHRNPRSANSCSECGSHELSTPHAPQSGMSKIGTVIGFLILGALSAYAAFYAYSIVTAPGTLLDLMLIGLGLGLVLLVWMFAFGSSKPK